MKMNEEATFAVYQKKLKGICEENACRPLSTAAATR